MQPTRTANVESHRQRRRLASAGVEGEEATMEPLLDVQDLKVHFYTSEGIVRAVDGVSFVVQRQRTLGVVGESGCGKSVTARSILGLAGERARTIAGRILYYPQEGTVKDLTQLPKDGRAIRSIRGREISMIFQEPMVSLSPVHTIGNQIMEVLQLHHKVKKPEAWKQAVEMLRRVGIPEAEERIDRYTYELSGGMRQRAMIAMALCCQPRLLIADEPTTALDVTIQAQILELIAELKETFQMSVMLITHDLGVVAEVAQDMVVMYLGKAVEKGPVKTVLNDPKHPYTQALIQAIPKIQKRGQTKLHAIAGVVPDAYNIPPGCAFHPRCSRFMAGVCDKNIPEDIQINAEHQVACFLYGGAEQ